MTHLLTEAWNGPRRPLVSETAGDLEWWFALAGPDVDWAERIRLWEVGGELVAWAWFKPPLELSRFVVDGLAADERAAIVDEALAWHADAARAALAEIPPPDTADPGQPPRLVAWAADGWPEAADLVARGWIPGDDTMSQNGQILDFDLDPPRVPDGYVLRAMRGPEDIPARVEVHRAAFAPSKMTVEKYEILVRQPHYAFERDVVIEAADGSFAAFAMCWADPVAAIGEFEPVGVHPDHQRRGLGRVVMRHGLRLLRAAGMRDAVVFSWQKNTASEALYHSAGFEAIAIHRTWTKPISGSAPVQSK